MCYRTGRTTYECLQVAYVILAPIVPRRTCVQCIFLVSWGGVRLSPSGTSANIWPIVPASDDR
jgi:hypothetical protein